MGARMAAIAAEVDVNLPDLDASMRFWIRLLGLDRPDQYGGDPWAITWEWADRIPHPNGSEAVGLNTGNGAEQKAHIRIRKPQSAAEAADLEDTIVHEIVHCIGERMQALFDVGKEVEAHEYLAETLAPAMVKIKGTPKAKCLAKAARTLPARAKGKPMDAMKLLLALCQGLMGLANLPEEAKALIQPVLDAASASGGDNGPPSAVPPLGAAPPAPEDKKPEPMAAAAPDAPPALGMGEPERYKKLVTESISALIEMRPDLSDEQKEHVRGLQSVDAAKSYFKAHPAMATKVEPMPQLGLGSIPRGGEDTSKAAPSGDKSTMRLFRIMPGAKSEMADGDGITIHDLKTSGKIATFSIVEAFNTIRANTVTNTQLAKAKNFGVAQ